MKIYTTTRSLFPSRLALVLLASAIAIPAFAQQDQNNGTPSDKSSSQGTTAAGPQSSSPAAAAQQPSPKNSQQSYLNTPKEGFWGKVNPFARKKWVNNRTEPIKGQLSELDEVNAKNAHDIQDVDGRAQAGIRRAQSSADAANEMATNAGNQAQKANGIAQGASAHVDQLNSTVAGLDQYHQSSEAEIAFRGGQPILSTAARQQLDTFAANLTGHQGYVLEIEGHSPLAGSAGIQSSGHMAEAVKRYLVTEHQIPVYRLHSVALGNAPVAGDEEAKHAKVSSVHIRLMENSLAAQDSASPHGSASLTGAERP